jgi:hypothetical protein
MVKCSEEGLFPALWRPLEAVNPMSMTSVGTAHFVDARRRARIAPHYQSQGEHETI